MKKLFVTVLFVAISLGCARVKVEAPKEAIKVDITMRLDVYQHVQKDINQIEDMVSGSPQQNKAQQKQTFMSGIIREAYAEEGGGLSPEVSQAALRRKGRLLELASWESKGVIGENRSGLLEVRGGGTDAAQALARDENSDRMVIYNALANKNNVSVREIQKMYAKRLQGDAPAGTPIEVLNQSGGAYEWRTK